MSIIAAERRIRTFKNRENKSSIKAPPKAV